MNNPISLVPPIINILVLAGFTGVVLRQFLRRQRPYQLYWTIGLLMALFGTIAYVSMLLAGPTSHIGVILFRSYYILGAALAPVWLGLGSVALVTGPRTTKFSLTALYILTALTIAFLCAAQIDLTKLAEINGTPGAGILVPGPWLVMIIIMNSLGVLTVVGVALYSGRNLLKRQLNTGDFSTTNLLIGNVLILLGDLINASAGTLARVLGIGSGFWIIMAVGWAVFFEGVLLVSRRKAIMIKPFAGEAEKLTVGTSTSILDATPAPEAPQLARNIEAPDEQAATSNEKRPSMGTNDTWEDLHFNSSAETALEQELEKAHVLFIPKANVRLGDAEPNLRETRCADFLVCANGKWGLLGIDTGQETLGAAQFSQRQRQLRGYGIQVIEHYTAENCLKDAPGIIREFLEQLHLRG